MSSMTSAECIIDIDVTELRKRCSKSINLGLCTLDFLSIDKTLTFLSRVESKILKKNDLTIRGFTACFLNLGADTVIHE